MAAFFFDQSGRLRTVWRFTIFGFGFLIVQLGLGIVLGIGLVVFLLATGKSLNSLDITPQSIEAHTVTLQIITALPVTLCSLGLVWLCRRYLDRRTLGSLGLVRPGHALSESVAGGLALGSLPIVFAIVILLAVGGLAWDGVSASLQTVLLVPTFVVMAFFEEIVCRGYLLQNLIDIGRPKFGIWFSSAIFWLLHALNPDAWSSPIVAVNLFGAGVTLALAYRVSHNIWFPTAAHFGWNFVQGVLFQVPVSGIKTDGLFDVHVVASAPAWLTGGQFGIEGSILATIAELGMSLVLIRVLLRRMPEILIAETALPTTPAEDGTSALGVPPANRL
jgi:membrane protease YdiL (CAAX protease family)